MRKTGYNPTPVTSDARFRRASTGSVPAGQRLDFWRSLFVASRIERPRGLASTAFRGELVTGNASDGIMFSTLQGDPVTCHFGERDSGIVLLGCIRSGTMRIEHGRSERLALASGSGLLLADCDRHFTTTSDRYGLTYLALPRRLVTNTLGTNPVARNGAVRTLPDNPLAASYQSLLRWMGDRLADGRSVPGAAALHTARALAIATLVRAAGRWRGLPAPLDDALFLAARYQLACRAGDAGITAARIAAILGCSRAHLYRLFAARDCTIAGELRTLRLQRARRLLTSHPTLTVGAVASQCGYLEHSAFDRAFQRAHRMTPGDYRRQAMRRRA